MSLQDRLDTFSTPTEMLRVPLTRGRTFPYPLVYTNWRDEQRAWSEAAVLFDQSAHMTDLFIAGPDTVRLLADTSVNSYANFGPLRAKQHVAVNDDGYVIGDTIIIGLPDGTVNMAGFEYSINWLCYQAEIGGYDVTLSRDEASFEGAEGKRLFRYELEGPLAAQILERASGRPLPGIPFFQVGLLDIAGVEVLALNHTMSGVPGQEGSGFELLGSASDVDVVVGAILGAGEDLGMLRGGALAYISSLAESGWMGRLVPAIYTGGNMLAYRRWLPESAMENFGMGMTGSFQPVDVEDYYSTPWDLGYGRLVRFDHDFIGRAALERIAEHPPRQKVWLEWARDDTERVLVASELSRAGAPRLLNPPFTGNRDLVLSGEDIAGITMSHAFTVNLGGWISLASVDTALAMDGVEVQIVWGDHDGGRSNPTIPDHEPVRIRATVRTTSPMHERGYASGPSRG
jgi:vanillate/3-O-methylgallate O-demethylase